MEQEGAKCVELVAKDDKGLITATLLNHLQVTFLPPQLMYHVGSSYFGAVNFVDFVDY